MKKTAVIIAAVALLLVTAVIVANFIVLQNESAWLNEHRTDKVFSDISEFEKLDEYAVAAAPKAEQYRSDDVEASYCKTVEYNGEMYQVYAFAFSGKQAARDFYKSYTGNDVPTDYGRYLKSDGLFFLRHTRYIVFCECNLYFVEGGNTQKTVEFINWLNASFAQDVQELEHADMAQ